MTTASLVGDRVERLVLHGTDRPPELERLRPRGLAPGALLLIRRLQVAVDGRADRASAAVTDAVADAERSAARPVGGRVPSDADAVYFADLAELVAVWCCHLVAGDLDPWWRRLAGFDLPNRLGPTLLAHADVLATIAARLVDLDAHAPVARTLAPDELVDAVERWATVTGRVEPAAAALAAVAHHHDDRPSAAALVAGRVQVLVALAGWSPPLRSRTPPSSPIDVPAPIEPDAGAGPARPASTAAADHTPRGAATRDVDPVPGVDSAVAPPPPELEPRRRPGATRAEPAATPRHAGPRTADHDPGPPVPVAAPGAGPPPASDAQSARVPDVDAGTCIADEVEARTAPGWSTLLGGGFYLANRLGLVDERLDAWAALGEAVRLLVPAVERDPLLDELAVRTDPDVPPVDAPTAQRWIAAIAAERDLGLDALRSLVATPATVLATTTHLDVFFGLDAVSLDARRRGLDLDPGWQPRLGAVLAFHFGVDP